MGLTSKAFSDIITFSRSSNATRIGPDGKVQYAPHNLQTYSEDFANAAWSAFNATLTSNAIAAPNGTVTADLIIPSATSSVAHGMYPSNLTVTSGVPYTLSVYAKASGYDLLNLFFYSTTASYGAVFNLSTGVVGSKGSSVTSSSITSVGNGWYRCSMTLTTAGTTANVRVYCGATDNADGTVVAFSGNGTSGVYVWGAQVSQGSIAGDYTPTTSAAVYGPRFDYDPVTLAAKGLLIEEQRTNLLTYSEQFDNAVWGTAGNVNITANAAVAPDGTTTADTMTEVATSATHRLEYITTGTSVATQYTVSFYVKAVGGSPWFRYSFTDSTGAHQVNAWFDLTNGVNGSTSVAGSGVLGSRSITAVGNGWYRCVMTGTVTGGAGVVYLYTGLANADGAQSYLGSASRAVYLWGAQLEAGAFATSYIPTVASTVTRSADVASVNTLSPWFNATEGTLFANWSILGDINLNNPVAYLTDGTENNYIRQLGSPIISSVSVGGTSQFSYNAGTPTSGTQYKAATAYKANDFAACLNGGTVNTDASGTIPTVSSLLVGSRVASGASLNGYIRRIAYYPRRLTNAELQALTA